MRRSNCKGSPYDYRNAYPEIKSLETTLQRD